MKRICVLCLIVSVFNGFQPLFSQTVSRNIRTKEYSELQARISRGWNTWYNNSVASHVLLPQGFSINLCLTKTGNEYLKNIIKTSKAMKRPEQVALGLRSDDGSYTSMNLKYKDADINIESASDGTDLFLLITPLAPTKENLVVEAGLLWNKPGIIGREGNTLTGRFQDKEIIVRTTSQIIPNGYDLTTSPNFCVSLKIVTGIYTGKPLPLDSIKHIISLAREKEQKRMEHYGELAESFKAMQTTLSWNTIYDGPNQRVITPAARYWSHTAGGFALFDWDQYLASLMFSVFNKELAYCNAVEITKSIMPMGCIPNYITPAGSSWDRSQPPDGSVVILELYKKFQDKWLLEEVYDELKSWNRWWPKNRDKNGFLAWGSNNVPDSLPGLISKNDLQAAMYESGLDNSPMYDGIPFNKEKNIMELADVGLMSFYIADCNALAEIAAVLGMKKDAAEFRDRAKKYTANLNLLWDEGKGIYLNKRLDTGEKSYRISPTNFYPMLVKACSQKQAERMINEHYFNPQEFYGEFVIPSIARNDTAFKDNDYWRGRIWAPMNFLVYLGMRNYDLPAAKADLVEKSKNLLMKSWLKDGAVYENYNAETGHGDDVPNAEPFYHWGALLAFISYMELVDPQ